MKLECNKCHRCLPTAKFEEDKNLIRGYRSTCRECDNARKKKWADKNKAKVEIKNRNYRNNNKDRINAHAREFRRNNIEVYRAKRQRNIHKETARAKVRQALDNGTMFKEHCMVCGSDRTHAHHEDYSKPLKVWWLCSQHHSDRHKHLEDTGIKL